MQNFFYLNLKIFLCYVCYEVVTHINKAYTSEKTFWKRGFGQY